MIGDRVVFDILKDDITKAIEKANKAPISIFHVAWDDRSKALILVEKRVMKNVINYEVHAIKVSLVEDKMSRTFVSDSTNNLMYLPRVIERTVDSVSPKQVEGKIIRDAHTAINMLLTSDENGPKSEIVQTPISLQQIPQNPISRIIGYICRYVNYNIEITNTPVFVSDELLLHHTVITGSTGGGKTEVAKRIVSEINKERKTVIVLTPEPRLWTSLDNADLVNDDSVEENKTNIIDFSSLKFQEESAKFLDELINYFMSSEQTNNLKLLLVIDEAHQFVQETLEKATRILRKYGIGIVMTSHTYADFSRGIRANIQTHIAMYTNWEKDISFIRQYQQKGSIDFASLLRHIPEGYGIFRSREFSRNEPLLCRFLMQKELIPKENENQEYNVGEADERRKSIMEFIKNNPGSSAEDVKTGISNTSIEVSNSTVYEDLAWLEDQGLIKVIKTEERGKKRYTVNNS